MVKDDEAYIAINNGFDFGNEVGLVGIADLTAQSYLQEIDLGAMGKNPEYIVLKNNEVFTLNNRDYTNASITSIDLSSTTPTTYDLAITSGCGTSLLAATNVLYQPYADVALSKFSTQTYSNSGSIPINQSIYGMAYDEVNNLLYAGTTDYVSTGKVFIYDLSGAALDSFDVSVSPGNIAFDVRNVFSVNEIANTLNAKVYPNPATDKLFINANAENLSYSVSDATGKVLANGSGAFSTSLNLSGFAAGTYFVSVTNGNETSNQLFIKL